MLTIVTPTLDAAEFVNNNIESIDQLDIDVEHIFVDGGSTDGTLEIIEQSLSNNRKLVHQQDNKGMYSALQKGFKTANGDWLAYVNADDQVLKEGFEKMYKEAINSNADLIYSDGYYYWLKEERYQKIKGRRFGAYHLKNGFLPFLQPSSIYRRETFEKVGGFRYDKFRISGDLDLFQRMALLENFKARYIAIPSTVFLKYGESLGDQNADLYHKEMEQLIQKNRNFLNKVLFKISGKF